MMAVAQSADQLPLETISLFCGEDQWITSAVIINPKTSRFANTPWLAENAARPALTRLGVSYLVTLEHPPAKYSASGKPERDEQCILSRLVREVRTQRPALIVVGGEPNTLKRPLDQMVQKAIQLAGDPKAYPEQLQKLNLQTWNVDKLYRVTQRGTEDASFNHRRYLTTLGMSIEDHVLVSRGFLNLPALARPATHLAQLYSHRPDGVREHQIFNEMVIKQHGRARRENSRQAAGSSMTYALVGRKSQSFSKLKQWKSNNQQMGLNWSTELHKAMNGLAIDVSGCWTYQLADLYLREGNPELTARALTHLVKSNPHHPFAEASFLWLLNYFNSDEMAYAQSKDIESKMRRDDTVYDPNVRQATYQTQTIRMSNQNGSVLIWAPPSSALDSQDDPRAILSPDSNKDLTPLERVERIRSLRMRQGNYVWQTLSNRSPYLPEEPVFKFSSICSKRKNEGKNVASFAAKNMASGHWDRYGFAGAALVERWLNDPTTPIGRVPVLNCQRAAQRPFLDGKLEDAIWETVAKNGAAQFLKSAENWVTGKDENNMTQMMVAFDEEFLFLAIRCSKSKDVRYPETATSRSYDQDLESFDRVAIQLDTDRDYATAFAMTMDSRGCVQESCGRDPGWNPKWYVASTQDDSHWTVEAAIRINELIPDNRLLKEPWAVSAKRFIPGHSQQVWPLASLEDSSISMTTSGLPVKGDVRPKEFGLLKFDLPETDDQTTENR